MAISRDVAVPGKPRPYSLWIMDVSVRCNTGAILRNRAMQMQTDDLWGDIVSFCQGPI